LSEAELERLLLYVQEKADAARRRGTTRAVIDEVIVLLLVNAGLRATELCDLTIADLAAEHGRNTLRVRDASGNVSRAVGVTSEMATYLRRFIELYRKDAKPNDPLLVSERGTRLAYISIFSKLKRIGRRSGLGNLNPRILRSTYVVRLYDREQDLRFVQQQAGHASLRTTAMYAIEAKNRGLQTVAPGEGDSETATRACHSSKQPVTERVSAGGAASRTETTSSRAVQHAGKCEACGKQIGAGGGTKIDSGQILCPECLGELHNI
jgi:integrase/recombinase XerD